MEEKEGERGERAAVRGRDERGEGPGFSRPTATRGLSVMRASESLFGFKWMLSLVTTRVLDTTLPSCQVAIQCLSLEGPMQGGLDLTQEALLAGGEK